MMAATPPPGYVSVGDAQRQLGIARQSMYHLIEMRRIASKRDKQGRIWVPQDAVDARLAGRQRLNSSQCISATEVSEFFGVDVRTVRLWHTQGLLHGTKIHNRLCFTPSDVIAFVPPTFAGAGRLPGRRATRTLRGRYYPPPGSQPTNERNGIDETEGTEGTTP
jgi:hypothetical protein